MSDLYPLCGADPAAVEALRARVAEVERLRAFVPRWRMKRYSPTAVTWRLFVGDTAIPDTGLHPTDAGRVFASGDGEGYPNIESAARAVCDRLGIPYVPVEEPVTPVRTPDVVRGDVPGLLCRGMPVHWRDEETRYVVTWAAPACDDDPEGNWNVMAAPESEPCLGVLDAAPNFEIDWSDRAAIYLCLAWLADRGHICTWMLPATHGGKVNAHDGLTAWEVSAILVSRSVVRVERGLGPVRDLLSDWRSDCFTYYREPYVGKERVWVYLTDADRMTDIGWALGRPRRGIPSGPETGDAGKLAADRAALADGCALLAPGGILLPD